MTRATVGIKRTAVIALSLALIGCGLVKEQRLKGQWQSVSTPVRTLDLFQDKTYSLRLSGKTLGFLSDMFGPEKGSWSVEGDTLVLKYRMNAEEERIHRWPIQEQSGSEVVLNGERWQRVRN